jgi:hypothetical protein
MMSKGRTYRTALTVWLTVVVPCCMMVVSETKSEDKKLDKSLSDEYEVLSVVRDEVFESGI